MADIFISYARKDRTRVRSLANALSAHGWSVWWDPEIQSGKRFSQVITESLASARCVIVVWSHQSIDSDWVREEADVGRQRGILIPVLIDDVRPPLGFGGIQAAELRDWSGAATSEAFQKLISDIAAVLGSPSRQEPVPNVADTGGEGDTAAPTVTEAKRHNPIALADQTRRVARTLGRMLSDRRVRWSLATVCLVAALVFGLYRLRTGGSRTPNATLQLDAILTAGGTQLESDVHYVVYEAGKDADGNRKHVADGYGGRARLPLPAGRYYVTATYGQAITGLDVDVPAGDQSIVRTVDLRAGILRLSSVLAAGGTPLTSDVHYVVYEAAKDADGNRKRVADN